MALPTVYPALAYRDAPAAITWLTKAFGLTERFVVEGMGGSIEHAELAWGDGGVIMLGSADDGDADRPVPVTGITWLYLVVDDPDEDYGNRGYTVRDPEGHVWSFGTYQPASAMPTGQ